MELSFLFILLTFAKFICGGSLHEQIYSSIEGGAACFRRLNGTHQAGCSTSNNGAVGVVHMLSNVSDAEWLAYNATAGPYMAVVSTALFNNVVELLMGHSHNVAGVLLYDSPTDKASNFTQESRCPNEYSSGPGSKCSSSQAGGIVWNEAGTGLLRRDIPFPIFYLPKNRSEEIDKIEQCYNRYNIDWENQKGSPLCSLELNSFMFAALNSDVCWRRSSSSSAVLTGNKVCDPLGDFNVYYSLFPRAKETATSKKPVTLVTARIDSASLFDGIAPGAASSGVGMVTLITAAAALSNMIPVTEANLYDHNILWTLFNGEAFDYIGSQRVAYDMSRGAWPPAAPLSPADVRLHLEVGQLGGALLDHGDFSWPLYAYASENVMPQISEFLNELVTYTNEYNMSVMPQFTSNLPPSSLHSFRRLLRNVTESGLLPEVLLADHLHTFTNKFYLSAIDDYDKIGFVYRNISIGQDGSFITTDALIENKTMSESDPQVKISKLATAIARTMYQKVTGQPYSGNVSASAHLVDEMLYCFLQSHECRLLLAADYLSGGEEEETRPRPAPPLYVGVVAWRGNPAAFAGHLLALLTGTHLRVNRSACDAINNPDFSHYYLAGWNHTGVCIQTTMNFSLAVSPAFITPDYDFASGLYSTWTESVWYSTWARVFVAAGGGGARAAAIAGSLATLIGAFLTYWLKTHAAQVFTGTHSVVNTDAATGILRQVNC